MRLFEFFNQLNGFVRKMTTLDSGIDKVPGINVAPRTFGKNNKYSPLKKHIPLHQMIDFRTFLWITLFNKDVAPGKNSKK